MAVTENYMADAPFLTAAEVVSLVFTNQNTDTSLITSEYYKAGNSLLTAGIGYENYKTNEKIAKSVGVN